jgi:chromate transporter
VKLEILASLMTHFAWLSLIAFGGASAVVPEMQRLVVDQSHWMTAQEFTRLFALAQAAPGPNVLIVTLIGWQVAGLAGALLATLAFCLPGGVLAYIIAQVWQRFRAAPWRSRIQAGLTPVTVGLVASTAWILVSNASPRPGASIGIAMASALLALRTRFNPLWLLAGGAVLGVAGWV